MSYVSYEGYLDKALSRPGVTMVDLLNVGDIVDSKIVSALRDDCSPVVNTNSFLQLEEAYVYVKDGDGVAQPCYLTFSFNEKGWCFCGACFEESVINRCNEFKYAIATVGEYCVDRFRKEYVAAAQRLCTAIRNGDFSKGLYVIDSFMDFDAYVMAGYHLDVFEEDALAIFKDSGLDYVDESLYEPVVDLLASKDVLIDDVMVSRDKQVDSVTKLIAGAKAKSMEFEGLKNGHNVVRDGYEFE